MTLEASCFSGTLRLLCPVSDSAAAASRESTCVTSLDPIASEFIAGSQRTVLGRASTWSLSVDFDDSRNQELYVTDRSLVLAETVHGNCWTYLQRCYWGECKSSQYWIGSLMTLAASCFPGTFRLLCPVLDSAYAASRESTRVTSLVLIFSKNNRILFGIYLLAIIAKMCLCNLRPVPGNTSAWI